MMDESLLTHYSTRPFTVPFLLTFAFKAPAKLLPVYFLSSVLNSSRSIYTATIGRPVSLAVAKAIIAVTCAVYTMSAVLLWARPVAAANGQGLEAEHIWRILPACIPFATHLLTTMLAKYGSEAQPVIDKEYMVDYYNLDYHPLTIWYRMLLAMAVFGHILAPNPVPGQQHLVTATVITHCLQNLFQLRNLGYITTSHAAGSMLATVLGTAMVGPVATYVGIWYWREHVIFKLTK